MRRHSHTKIGPILIAGAIVAIALTVGVPAQANPQEKPATTNLYVAPAKPSPTPIQQSQQSQTVGWCSSKNGVSPDQQIAGCTALIEANKLAPKQRAIAFAIRGNGNFAKKQYELALKDYDQAIELDASAPIPYWNRGNAFSVKGQYDRAIQEYDHAIKLNPAFSQAFFGRALAYQNKAMWDFDAYLNEGRYETLALQDYSEAIRLNPKGSGAYNNRGNIYRGLRQHQQAIADYDEAIRLDPNNVLYLKNRADVYRSAGEYDRAISDYQKALTLNGDESLKKLIVLALTELGVKT